MTANPVVQHADDQPAPNQAGNQAIESSSAVESTAVEAADSEQAEAVQGINEKTTAALDQQAQANNDTAASDAQEESEVGQDESSTGDVEQRLQQMALQSSEHASGAHGLPSLPCPCCPVLAARPSSPCP